MIPEEELIRQLAVYAPGREDQIRDFIHTFAAQFEQMPYSKQWIRDLKERGFAVYFLSNYSHQAINANREVLDFIPLMDGGVFSCDVGLIKPEPEIYQLLCSKYGLRMEECVFIDDKQANTDAAKALGMQAITFRGYEEAVRELEEIMKESGFGPDSQKPGEKRYTVSEGRCTIDLSGIWGDIHRIG